MTEGARASQKRDPLTEEFLRYLTNERNASPRTLKAYRHALTSFRTENQTPWKKCAADDFRNYLFGNETRARTFIRAAAILSITHFLSVSRRSETAAR